MSFDGSTIVKINNPKLKALLEEAEKKGLCIEPFMENKRYDFSCENYDCSIVDGCPTDLDDLKDYILQLIAVVNDFDHNADYWFKNVFEAEYPNLKDSFTYVSWTYVPADYDRSDYDDDVLEFKYGKPGGKKASNKKKNGPSTLKEIFPGIDMTKSSGLVVDDDGCCTSYDWKQHAEFLGEENCLFITKDVKIIDDEDYKIFDLLTTFDKCVVTTDLEDFGDYTGCGGFHLFYIIDAETNKVVYSSEKDEFFSNEPGFPSDWDGPEEELYKVLCKYTKCGDSNCSEKVEEELAREILKKTLEDKPTAKKSSTTSAAKTSSSKSTSTKSTKKNGPSTLKEIFPGIDMTKPSGLEIDDDGCCKCYDFNQHAEFLGENNCLFLTKDVKTMEDDEAYLTVGDIPDNCYIVFNYAESFDKCVVTTDLEDFGPFYDCSGFHLFYIIDAKTNKVVYSSEKDEFCAEPNETDMKPDVVAKLYKVLEKYTKCDGSKFYGEIEEEDDEDEKEEEDTSTSHQDKAEDLIDDAEARAEEWMQYYGEYINHNPVIDFDGSLFVFTGFGHRDDKDHPIVQKVIEKGGQYRSKVSGLTNYLVVDPRGAGDTKVQAAIEQRENGKNIQIVLLEDLEKALEGKTTAKKSSATSAKTTATKTSSSKSTSARSTTKSKRDSSSSGKNSTETSKSSYDIDETTGKLMNYRGRKKDIVLPNGIKIVGENAFKNKKITSVVIPEGVETIEAYAFSSCTSLNSVTLPNTIKKIGEHAFEICKYLTNIIIPEGVETIEAYAFFGCWHLNSVMLPNTIKRIGEYAFYSCEQLTSIVIPEGVETIDAYSLSCCENLKSVTLPNTLKKIGKSAFYSCEQLTSIVIPEGVETIDDDAFSECKNLKSVTLPNTLKTIGEDAFSECEQLTSIVIPEGVDTIEKGVFSKCNNLDKVVLPSTIKKIGDTAFAWCRNLTSIIIPEGCEEIDGGAFLECEKLKDIYVPDSVHAIGDIAFYTENDDTTVHTIRGSCADISADGDYKVDYQYPTSGTATIVSSRTTYTPASSSRANATCSNSSNYNTSSGSSSSGKNSAEASNSNYVIDDTTGRLTKYKGGGKAIVLPKGIKIISERVFENEKIFSIVIPEGVETIEAYAFFGCENLKSVTLPNTLKKIGKSAFSECEQLTSIVIPEGVDSIENEVFYDCYNLNKVVLPSSVKKIGDSAFSFCKLTRIVVPEGCEELGKNAFYMCDKLKDIYVPDSVHTIGKYAFNTDNDDTTVHTIKGSYADISADGDYKVDYQYPTSSTATVVSSKTTYTPTSSSRTNNTSNNSSNSTNTSSGGCYVATAVYGSYDCPEVWTLRRYRDYTLAETWYGRAFIKAYYAISPTLVKWFGHTEWFKTMWRGILDPMVSNLRKQGVESSPYQDRNW